MNILGKNAAMKIILAKSAYDKRIGHSLTAPKLALQLSDRLFIAKKGSL